MTPERRRRIEQYISKDNPRRVWDADIPQDKIIRELLAEIDRLNDLVDAYSAAAEYAYRRDDEEATP
jgi:hypothetical protein